MTPELTTDLSVLEQLVELDGRDVVDIGCGEGALTRALAARGARVTGVETSEEQLAGARARANAGAARYLIGRAERLPLDDESVDVAVFMRSLHHSPPARALAEARRVLRPGGFVYAAEPLAEGDYWSLVRLVDDEREVRLAAQQAIAQAAGTGLQRVRTVDYRVPVPLSGLDAFRARTVSADPGRAAAFAARAAELSQAFRRLGQAGDRPGERCFVQPMRADLLRR